MKKLLLLGSLLVFVLIVACNNKTKGANQKKEEVPAEEKVITHGNPDPGLVDSLKNAKTKGKKGGN